MAAFSISQACAKWAAVERAGWCGANWLALRAMMRAVVASGTGRQADAPGYQVLGKTGSAEKPQAGGYNKNALVTSFLGAFPARAPRYAMLVMLDEPQATDETYGYGVAWTLRLRGRCPPHCAFVACCRILTVLMNKPHWLCRKYPNS